MDIRGVLLDFDGVISDSFREGLRRIQMLCALRDLRFERDTRTKLFNSWGLPGIELLTQCLGINETLARYIYMDWEKLDKNSPPPRRQSA